MKILAFTDIHGSLEAMRRIRQLSKKADLLLCAGDLTLFEINLKEMINDLAKTKKPVLVVHGNHESGTSLRKASAHHRNIVYIHKRCCQINGIRFIGFGGGGFAQRDKELEAFTKAFTKSAAKQKTVLVVHAPPYGTRLDRVAGYHLGSKSVTQFIKKASPALAVCGHLHENSGKTGRIGKTLIVNPGPKGKILRI